MCLRTRGIDRLMEVMLPRRVGSFWGLWSHAAAHVSIM